MRKKSATITLAVGLLACACVRSAAIDDKTEFQQAYSDYQQLVRKQEYETSLPLAKRALELGERLYEPAHENLPTLTYNYGWNLVKVKKYTEAKPVLKTAIKRYEALYGKKTDKLIPVLMDLGHANTLIYDSSQQTKFYRRALRLSEKHRGGNSVAYAQRSLDAGIFILEQTRTYDARRYLEDALDIFNEQLGPEHPRTGLAAFYIGKLNLARKRHKKARDHFLVALKSFKRPDQPSNSFEMGTHAFLVQVYEELEQSSEATKHCLAIGRMSPAKDSQNYQPLFRLAPKYPFHEQQRGREGHVIVEFTVDDSGFVKDVVAKSSTHTGFEKSALAAVEQWRYAPRFKDGIPVSTPGIRNKLSFALAD